jgi:hypothetical protein
MSGSPIVSRATAHQKRTHHQFVAGLGYIAHEGPPELPPAAQGTKNCQPPSGTADRSVHVMQPPGGAGTMLMVWHADGAWGPIKPGQGNRMAWEPSHLSRAGWEYVGPADGAPARGKGKRA